MAETHFKTELDRLTHTQTICGINPSALVGPHSVPPTKYSSWRQSWETLGPHGLRQAFHDIDHSGPVAAGYSPVKQEDLVFNDRWKGLPIPLVAQPIT